MLASDKVTFASKQFSQEAAEKALKIAEQQLLRIFEIAVMQYVIPRNIQPQDALFQEIADDRFLDFVARRTPDSFRQRDYLPREQAPDRS